MKRFEDQLFQKMEETILSDGFLEDYIQRFGNTHQGIGKILTKMNINSVWRKCVYSDGAKWAEDEDASEIYYSLIDEQASGGVIARR